MKIIVKIIKENKDGSAVAQVDFDKDGLEVLVQHGLVSMLTQAVDAYRVRPEDGVEVIEGSSLKPVKKNGRKTTKTS
jgi:hypothetical protein